VIIRTQDEAKCASTQKYFPSINEKLFYTMSAFAWLFYIIFKYLCIWCLKRPVQAIN